jgi:hypothetical protein
MKFWLNYALQISQSYSTQSLLFTATLLQLFSSQVNCVPSTNWIAQNCLPYTDFARTKQKILFPTIPVLLYRRLPSESPDIRFRRNMFTERVRSATGLFSTVNINRDINVQAMLCYLQPPSSLLSVCSGCSFLGINEREGKPDRSPQCKSPVN